MARWTRRLLVAAGATLGALLVAELAARFWLVRASGATDFASYRGRCLGEQLTIFDLDPTGDLLDLKPDTRQGGLITINRQGFRGKPVAEPKPEDGFRICCIGGSGLFGTTSSGDAATIPAFLERELRAGARRPESVEVINGGLPGATTARAVSRFEKRLRDRGCDVLVNYGLINDLMLSRRERLGFDARLRPLVSVSGPVTRLLSHSALYLAFATAATQREKEHAIAQAREREEALARGRAGGGAAAVRGAVAKEAGHAYDGDRAHNLYLVPGHVAQFRAELDRFARVAREAGAVPVYCTFALRFRGGESPREYEEEGPVTALYLPSFPMALDAVAAMNEEIRAAARAANAPLCDVDRDLPRQRAYFAPKDTDHFTDAGCAAVAAILAKTLRSAGLLARGAEPR